MIRYCTLCLLPETKPDLSFDSNGACSACIAYQNRKSVDWGERAKEFMDSVRKHSKNPNWDCIVPVSGGKDSTWQVLKLLELGLRPLCVNSTTCDESEIGRRNLRNIRKLGVDSVSYSPNPKTRATMNRLGLELVGDISWPEHLGIFSIPVRAAVQFEVPLIVWGENSQNEYGGPAASQESQVLDRSWLEEFGGLIGLRASDLPELLPSEDPRNFFIYQYPTNEELEKVGVTGLFLGYFFPWDGVSNAILSQAWGFESFGTAVEGSIADYENLDNHQTGIHDYFKYLKFGFGRATDIASLHIRRGRITRSEALKLTKVRDGMFPWSYLGKRLEQILDELQLSIEEFHEICDTNTNSTLFKKTASGDFIRNPDGSPVKTNYDNED
jgi:N-acetyl sugar amidotransferase